MNFVRGIIAALFLVAVVAAGAVVAHGSQVQDAGKVVGYTPPVTGQRLLVLGDSFSLPAETNGPNWPFMLTSLNKMQLQQQSAAGTGWVTNSPTGEPFPKRARNIAYHMASHKTKTGEVQATLPKPNYIVVWAAHDDIAYYVNKTEQPLPLDAIKKAMVSTFTTLKKLVPPGHLIVVGPVSELADKNPSAATRIQKVETSAVRQAGLRPNQFVDASSWFGGDNASLIGANQAPTDAGQYNALYYIQRALQKAPLRLGNDAQAATSVVPPYLPTVTATQTVVATETRTSISRGPTRTQSVRVSVTRTVIPPPVIVTVTAPATP